MRMLERGCSCTDVCNLLGRDTVTVIMAISPRSVKRSSHFVDLASCSASSLYLRECNEAISSRRWMFGNEPTSQFLSASSRLWGIISSRVCLAISPCTDCPFSLLFHTASHLLSSFSILEKGTSFSKNRTLSLSAQLYSWSQEYWWYTRFSITCTNMPSITYRKQSSFCVARESNSGIAADRLFRLWLGVLLLCVLCRLVFLGTDSATPMPVASSVISPYQETNMTFSLLSL